MGTMSVGTGIWDKLTRAALFVFFIAFVVLIVMWYLPLIHMNERLRRQRLDLDGQIDRAQLESRQIKSAEDAMRDPKTIERLARERLGVAKTGETVVRFDGPVLPTITNSPRTEPARR